MIIILFFITIYVIYNYTNKKEPSITCEKYIDLGDEITPDIQTTAYEKLSSSYPKLETIQTNMTTTNGLLNDIITSQSSALTNITTTVTDNISKLSNINKKLDVTIKQIKKQINGTVIPVTENFEDVSKIYENQTNKSNINNNDMNNKEKLTEYFYNYVPPKQNVYEGFFDWKDEWNRKVNDIGLSLNPTSVIKDGSYHDVLPVVAKKDMPKNMNETTAKIISLAVTNDATELLKTWRQDLRKNDSSTV